MRKRRVAILGSTGSIGRSTIDVVRRLGDRFEVHALAARVSSRRLTGQARRLRPARIVTTDRRACQRARKALGREFSVEWGLEPLIDIARSPKVDILVMAMSGTMGLLPVVAALEKGKRVAIATKEILVAYGQRVMALAGRHGGEVLPVDSELAAIHQCLRSGNSKEVKRVVLTASGGPFRDRKIPARATVRQVLDHPTWQMGRKITVDSATLMNKGLEAIETSRLFGLDPHQVEAVVHPQSIVHSFVEFADGSVIAQLSDPDMRLPIQYALCYPDRLPSPIRPLNLLKTGSLDFAPIDTKRFPCYDLARSALRSGPQATCALNAANERAVRAFLAGRIVFHDIPAIIRTTLKVQSSRGPKNPTIAKLMDIESSALSTAEALVNAAGGN